MDREQDVIELGIASDETKGGGIFASDEVGQSLNPGLSDD